MGMTKQKSKKMTEQLKGSLIAILVGRAVASQVPKFPECHIGPELILFDFQVPFSGGIQRELAISSGSLERQSWNSNAESAGKYSRKRGI